MSNPNATFIPPVFAEWTLVEREPEPKPGGILRGEYKKALPLRFVPAAAFFVSSIENAQASR